MRETLTTNEQIVYDFLQDEKSRKIFEKRRAFADSKTVSFIDVFDTNRRVRDISELRLIMNDRSFVCYGAGDGCRTFLNLMNQFGYINNCCAVFDSNKTLHGKLCLGGEKIVSHYSQSVVDNADKIVITPFYYSVSDEIKENLINLGVKEDKIIVLSEYYAVNNMKIYFDTQIIGQFGKDEIFVDVGCLDFSTSSLFLKYCPNTLKIYVVEPIYEQIEIIKRNIKQSGFTNVKIINGALWSHNTKLNFDVHEIKSASKVIEASDALNEIDAYALDDIIDIDDKITFIKMDIEGSELEALKGSERIIKKYKPKLAISIYHKPFDYVDIPLYIKSIVPEYRMFFRHYTSFDTETVLYCVL